MTDEELEKENKLFKSLLHCTTRSCNNCGKVNCENFQRQRIDCCGLWVSSKDYISELESENEKLRGFKHIVQRMKDNGFDTMSVKEFLQEHRELKKENAELREKLSYWQAEYEKLFNEG